MKHEDSVLSFVELAPDKTILPISLECITAGRSLAEALGCGYQGLLLGSAVAEAAEALSHFGLDAVCTVDHPLLGTYHPERTCCALLKACEALKPRAIIMGETLASIDLAPRAAFALNAGLITDCVGFEMDEGDIHFIKPVYSSNVMAAYAPTTVPYLVTMRSRARDPAGRLDGAGCEVIPLDLELDESAVETEVIGRVLEEEEGPKLASANVIVAGGRGVGGPEGFTQLSELANLLNAALGASRPPVDLGWAPSKAQVGQTGEKVAPSVYIAVGISGATQHIAGMSASKTVVAINKDPRANIFKIADYGVVGRQEEVVPAFLEAMQEILRQGGPE